MDLAGSDFTPGFAVNAISSSTEYAPARIGAAEVWIPRRSETNVESEGIRLRNVTGFESCREFRTETVVRFDDAVPAAPSPADGAGVPAQRIPPGLELKLRLESALDTETSAVGDPVAARLAEAARAGELNLPAGSIVRGRVLALERHTRPYPFYFVALSFTGIEGPGGAVHPLAARLARTSRFPGISLTLKTAGESEAADAERDARWGFGQRVQRYRFLQLPEEPGMAVFFVKAASFRLPAGFDLELKTERPD
jgi:hypothetical protein